LSDGTVISRIRKLGASTQLTVHIAGIGMAKQEYAQRELYTLIGMDHEDLMATSFIEQRQIARLILADPAERTRIVNGWMELDPLQKAEAWLKDRLLRLLEEERTCVVPDVPEGLDRTALEVTAGCIRVSLSKRHAERVELNANMAALGIWLQHAQYAEAFPDLQARGKQLRVILDALPHPDFDALVKARDDAALEKGDARAQEEQLTELLDQRWDGICPKTCSDCPVQDHVRNSVVRISSSLVGVEQWMDDADAKFRAADEAWKAALRVSEQADHIQLELAQLRTTGEHLIPSLDYIEEHGAPPDIGEVREQIVNLDATIRVKERELAEVEANIRTLDVIEAKRGKLEKRRKQLEGAITLHREAVAIVGRQGAQKEIAEAVLAEIEAGANMLLNSAGIDLTIEVSWSREGRGLATHCDTCGWSYPKSTTVKECTLCGATRGPKQVEKLVIQPNDRSGAADDIAGLAFQLAASFWLRAKRSAPWAVACIDEPFGQLDRANSRALSAHMHTLIRGSYAFEQGFLVAHDASIMESLPARVQIRGTDQGSSVEVL
jgi:DNA repair exonuclease SbcCD ATPase subunit